MQDLWIDSSRGTGRPAVHTVQVQYAVVHRYRGHSCPRETTSGGGTSLPTKIEHLEHVVKGQHGTQVYLFHSPEHLIAAPLGKPPVIVVLFNSSYANCSVAATASSQESASGNMALTTVQSGLGRSHDIPIGFSFVVHRPSTLCQKDEQLIGTKDGSRGVNIRSCHMHVVHFRLTLC